MPVEIQAEISYRLGVVPSTRSSGALSIKSYFDKTIIDLRKTRRQVSPSTLPGS